MLGNFRHQVWKLLANDGEPKVCDRTGEESAPLGIMHGNS